MTDHKRRVVIVGAGFGGLSATRALAKADVDITLIDRHNYHLFQPLLYQIATAALSPAEVASPIRSIVNTQKNVSVSFSATCRVSMWRDARCWRRGRTQIGFDDLIVATGAQHAYFGHDDWATAAPGLKTIDDATYLRRRILLAFEKAEIETDAAERRRLLNFVVIGGGPTGVEMAGAIAELARRALAGEFRAIDPRKARIILVEAGPRLLPAFSPSLSEIARVSLEKLGVEVRLDSSVTGCDDAGVSIGATRIEARTIMWAAGVIASPAGRWLDAATDRAGRVNVLPDLSAPNHPDIFVIGDTANVATDGKPLPGVAPVAKQQGVYVGKLIAARIAGKTLPPFRYRDLGSLSTIGRKSAVVEMGRFKIHGFIAWLFWSVAHIYFPDHGFRNRAVVAPELGVELTSRFQRGTRLITGMSGARIADVRAPPQGQASICATPSIRGVA